MAGKLKQCYKRFLRRTGIRKGLIGGVLVLLVVDLIWVASAALSRFLYVQESYPKPFFTTYFKTVLFSIYLTAFVFWRPWQRLCVRGCTKNRKSEGVRVCSCGEGRECVCGKEEIDPLFASESDTPPDDHTPAPPTIPESTPHSNTSLTIQTNSSSHQETSHNISTLDHPYPPDHSHPPDHSYPPDHPYPLNLPCPPDHSYPPQSQADKPANPSPSSNTGHTIQGTTAGSGTEEQELKSCLATSPDGGTSPPVSNATPPSHEPPSYTPAMPTDSANSPDHTFLSVPDSSPSQSATCPFTDYIRDSRIVPVEGVCGGEAKLVFTGAGYGSISGRGRLVTCPVNPDLKICLLGPPEYEPLGCYEESSDEDEHKPNEPLSPCDDRCCKVRFKPTVEVREVKGEGGSVGQRLFRSLRVKKERWKRHEMLSVWKVALLAAIFGVVWFFANYLYSVALNLTSVAAVNTLSSTSGVFVMALAALPCLSVTAGDTLTLSRCLVTIISVGGAILVSLSPSGDEKEGSKFSPGALFALGGSVLYAIYLVLLRRVVTDHDSLDIPMFFGFVGLFVGILLLPLLVVWDVAGIEPFEVPPTPDVWTLLLVNGFVGTVLSELLWLWGVFLTSPLLGTLALSLVTPLSITYSIVVGKAAFSWMFLLGAMLILLSFITVTILDHYGAWDPLWEGLKNLFLKARDYRYHREFRSLSPESRSLITNSNTSPCQDYFSPT